MGDWLWGEGGEEVDESGIIIDPEDPTPFEPDPSEPTGIDSIPDDAEGVRRKFYFDGGLVEVAAHLVYELDTDGRQLRVVKYTDYAANKVRSLFTNAAEMRQEWSDPVQRAEIIAALEERGISLDELRNNANQPDADPFDLLCHIAFNAPLRTRRERADHMKRSKMDFFESYGPQARGILNDLLEKYAEFGVAQFDIPDVLQIPPISVHGNVMEIAGMFGGPEKLRQAVNQLQGLLYAA